MKIDRNNLRAFAGVCIALSVAWLYSCMSSSLPAIADSESGLFVYGGGESESGGAADTGASSDSGGVLWGQASTQSGGPQDSGAESDSGGVVETGNASESGGPDYQGNTDENRLLIRTYHW